MNSFSMSITESYILTNDGSKIYIIPNSFRIDNKEKTVFYKLPNSNVDGKIKFKDFDYIQIGKNKFKIYRINDFREPQGYFVLSETDTNTLIFTTKASDDEESTQINYVFYVLESNNNNNIVDGLEFDNLKNPKSINARGEIFSKIQFYFKDCETLIKRITSYDNLSVENKRMDILNFFNSPVYSECKK